MYGFMFNRNGNDPTLNVEIPHYSNPKNSFDLTPIQAIFNFWEQLLVMKILFYGLR
jgi:hypothetical protein